MTLTPSKMVELKSKAPTFNLPDTVSGKKISYSDVKKPKGLVVMFICNHCPFVKHVQTELVKVANDYQKKA